MRDIKFFILFLTYYLTSVVMFTLAFPLEDGINDTNSSEGILIYTPDQYAFNVSCLNCFIP